MTRKAKSSPGALSKSPTGIRGLDEITGGGLPTGRPTLVCGSAGCGKTMLAMEFLVHGAVEYGEPGVFIAFEETRKDLAENVASLGFDIEGLIAAKKLAVDHVHIERSEIEETGEYDLEGLFIRLGHAIDSVGARRVVLDTVEVLFAGLSKPDVLRAELRRLFRWLKDRNVTVVITGERGEASLTRLGIEEYVSDCVILLDHRLAQQISTRRLRVVKYRGSVHGTNEYPFLIDRQGISVLPVSSIGLDHKALDERIPTGIARLDFMLGGKGYFRGSSVLISGSAGCGKTSIAAHFADATCRRGERCLFFLFEESPSQMIRNMRSIGLNLEPWVKKGLLQFHAARPSLYGLETHLAVSQKAIDGFKPLVVIVDPISVFSDLGNDFDVNSMLLRLVDSLKMQGITALMTCLTGSTLEHKDEQVSSLIDTWLLVRDLELNGERNRGIYVLKSRGMSHSKQIREFVLTDHGVELIDVYAGTGGVLTGSARIAQAGRETAERLATEQNLEQQQAALTRSRRAFEVQTAVLQAEFAADEVAAMQLIRQGEERRDLLTLDRATMATNRQGDAAKSGKRPGAPGHPRSEAR